MDRNEYRFLFNNKMNETASLPAINYSKLVEWTNSKDRSLADVDVDL